MRQEHGVGAACGAPARAACPSGPRRPEPRRTRWRPPGAAGVGCRRRRRRRGGRPARVGARTSTAARNWSRSTCKTQSAMAFKVPMPGARRSPGGRTTPTRASRFLGEKRQWSEAAAVATARQGSMCCPTASGMSPRAATHAENESSLLLGSSAGTAETHPPDAPTAATTIVHRNPHRRLAVSGPAPSGRGYPPARLAGLVALYVLMTYPRSWQRGFVEFLRSSVSRHLCDASPVM